MKVIALDYTKLEENSQIEMIMPTPCFSIQGNIISVLMRVCHAGSRTMTKQDGLIAMTSHDRQRNLYFCSTYYTGQARSNKTLKRRIFVLWSVMGASTGDRSYLRIKGQWYGKCVQVMMSSCICPDVMRHAVCLIYLMLIDHVINSWRRINPDCP